MDPNQFGFIPDSCTTFALISMLHHWFEATDGTGAHVRAALLDYKKAFDLVDHNLLIAKLFSLGAKPTIVNSVADFLRDRYQLVKLNFDCFSDFKPVPAGILQGTRTGPWLFLVMINDQQHLIFHIGIRRRHHSLRNCSQVWCISAPRYST